MRAVRPPRNWLRNVAAEIGLGVAIELPEGIFKVIGEWRYSGMALQWYLWELDTGEGQALLLARVGKTYYTPRFDSVEALPARETLNFEGTPFEFRYHGEARVERSVKDEHYFWLAKFQHFVAPGKVLIVTEDKDAAHRLVGEELDEELVQVYEG